MQRRTFTAGLIAATATWHLAAATIPAFAQTPGRVYRLGHLGQPGPSELLSREIVLPELAKLGFVESRNLVFDGRSGNPDALPGMMRDLLGAMPDAVIAIGDTAIVAAGKATRTVPIIGFGSDAVTLGLAQSFARPGGNVTGVTILLGELDAKRWSILREAAPDRRRVATLVSTTQRESSEPAMRKAAASVGVELLVFPVATPVDYPAAFTGMKAAGVEALVIAGSPEFNRDIRQLAALALEARLPTVCEWADNAREGCLIGYGPSRPELRKRMAHQIAAIFRGTAPGEIPIELPTRFQFAVNQKIATSLGLTIPAGVLLRADEVIE